MLRIVRVMMRALLLICPACTHGRMFRSRFKMNVRCPVCGVIFERDTGEVTGGMAINMVATSAIAVIGGGALALLTNVPVLVLIGGIGAISTLFALWFYRHARGLWIGIVYLTGSIFED